MDIEDREENGLAIAGNVSEIAWTELAPVTLASIGSRFWASVIDSLILGVAGAVITFMGNLSDADAWMWLWALLSLLIPAAYFIWPYSTHGQTWGKSRQNIRVASSDGSPLTWRKGILRYLGLLVSGAVLGLGYLWAIFDKDNQTWHDKLAGTVVVRGSANKLRPRLTPEETRRRQRRWLLVLGVPFLAIVAFAVYQFIPLQTSWVTIAPDASPEQVAYADLAHLGLELALVQDARDQPAWAVGSYEEGTYIAYVLHEQGTLSIWGLRYQDEGLAKSDFDGLASWAKGNCGSYSTKTLGRRGIVTCRAEGTYNRILLNGNWIIDILYEGPPGSNLAGIVEEVNNALEANWDESNQSEEQVEFNLPAVEDSQNPHVFLLRGYLYQESGDLEAAIANYNRAIELDPENVDAINNRGMIHLDSGLSDLAREDFETVIALDKTYALAHNNLGYYYSLEREWALAIEHYDRALSLDPDEYTMSLALVNRAMAYEQIGKKEEAIDDWRALLKIHEDPGSRAEIRGRLEDLGVSE